MGTALQAIFGASFVAHTTVSSFCSKSAVSIWMMINIFQMFRYVQMFAVYLPHRLFAFLSYINLVNMESAQLESLYLLHVDQDQLSYEKPADFRITYQGIESTSILVSCAGSLMMVTLVVCVYSVIGLLSLCVKDTSTRRHKYELSRHPQDMQPDTA